MLKSQYCNVLSDKLLALLTGCEDINLDQAEKGCHHPSQRVVGAEIRIHVPCFGFMNSKTCSKLRTRSTRKSRAVYLYFGVVLPRINASDSESTRIFQQCHRWFSRSTKFVFLCTASNSDFSQLLSVFKMTENAGVNLDLNFKFAIVG